MPILEVWITNKGLVRIIDEEDYQWEFKRRFWQVLSEREQSVIDKAPDKEAILRKLWFLKD